MMHADKISIIDCDPRAGIRPLVEKVCWNLYTGKPDSVDETVFPHKQACLSCLDVLQAKFTARAIQNPSIPVLLHKIYGVQTRLPVLASSSSRLQLALYPSGNRPCMSAILFNLLN